MEALTEATDRSKDYLAVQAIEGFIDMQKWQIQAIQEGILAADREEFEPAEKVKSAFQQWGVDVEH